MIPPSEPTGPASGALTFPEPWQAQVFALAVSLRDRGLFTWDEWSATLAAEAATRGGEADSEAWLAAVETLLVRREVTTPRELAAWRDAWDDAARHTPHGQPIVACPPRTA